jgi:hypothetical protein
VFQKITNLVQSCNYDVTRLRCTAAKYRFDAKFRGSPVTVKPQVRAAG